MLLLYASFYVSEHLYSLLRVALIRVFDVFRDILVKSHENTTTILDHDD